MPFDTTAFRARYRAGISPRYNAWRHAGFVAAYGALWLGFYGLRLDHVRALEWATVPLALVVFNVGEYVVHRQFGHHKRRFGGLFYQRHTGDHHSFFSEGQMAYEGARDWRVILFPAWLIVLFSLALLPAWWAIASLNGNVAALFCGTLLLGYLGYELFHACEHLPDRHPLARLPWIRHMRRLHARHHRRELMTTHNFNLVFPLTDWLRGTLHREAPPPDR